MADDVLLPFEDKNLREPYREYYTSKRKNYQVVLRDIPELWDCFLRLDEIWARSLDDMQYVTQKELALVIAMFKHAHQQFRISFELGCSTALSEAWNVQRSSIDTAVVARKMCREPQLMAVYLRRSMGKAEKTAYRKAFDEYKETNLFAGLPELYKFYQEYSESGTHPGFGAIALHIDVTPIPNGLNFQYTYLQVEPKRLTAFLFRLLEASALVEQVCFDCFKDRLKLDDGLCRMRTDCATCINKTASVVNDIIQHQDTLAVSAS